MKMIVAVDEKWGIGIDGDLLTPLPEDMKFFRETTKNSVIIMGRKTLLSFPNAKPLKNRVNIVITTNEDYNPEGCVMARSVEEVAQICNRDYEFDNVFVVGGGTIYRQMLDYCETAYITKIRKTFHNADTFITDLDKLDNWKVVYESEMKNYEGIEFSFLTYEKQK